MQVTLRQLRIFEAVARHGSLSRAAHELSLTQPAVSMQIKQMEDQLGLVVIHRVNNRFVLTDAGQELCFHATRIGKQIDDMLAAMDQFRELERGILRIAVVSSANYFLPPLIANFSETFPGVRVSLTVANREAVLAAVRNKEADFAITGQPPEATEIVAQYFMDNPLVAIASPHHLLSTHDHIDLCMLEDETLVVREPGSGTRAAMERFFTDSGINYQAGCELSTNEAIKQAVQAGLGIGIVPAQTIELELLTRRLVILPVAGFPIIRRWFILHRSDKKLSSSALAFRALLFGPHMSKVFAGSDSLFTKSLLPADHM